MVGINHASLMGPWTKPLNWDLQATSDGEPCIPFALYVKPELTPIPCPAFLQFRTLPTKLQLRILRFCDAPTLFRLMQVSSALRVEARKLFWSCPDAWYKVEAYWLLAGGFPGHAHHAIDILPHVEQIEVNFESMHSIYQDCEAEVTRGRLGESVELLTDVKGRARDFWQTLQYRFPHATNVVISESRPRGTTESLPVDLKIMVEMCPEGICASASFLKRAAGYTRLLERSLWRQAPKDIGTTGAWQQITSTWTRQSILLPPKEFRGPVGEYEWFNYRFHRFCRDKTAARLLVIEAVERHHFHERRKSFDCFESDCDARFREPGEWTLHALDKEHHRSVVLPDEVKALFDQNDSLLEQMFREHEGWAKIKADWGEEGSEKRHNVEQAVLHQLDHDPLYAQGKPARECSMWFSYTLDMDPMYIHS